MASVNIALIMGNLGGDPTMRYTQDGTAICNFSVATSETFKPKGGAEKKQKTEWHKIVCFGKLAENCCEYLKKGSSVWVEGKIQYGSYEDKNGETKYTTDIAAKSVTFLDTKQKQDKPASIEGEQRKDFEAWNAGTDDVPY